MAILIHIGIEEASLLKWIFSGVYDLGLLLFISASIVSKLDKRKLLFRVLSIVSTFLMASGSICTLILLARAGISPTFSDVLFTTIVILHVIFNSLLFILAILGELDSMF